ncbi:hypothetical protein ETU08_07080 [Apibacter muscae]|uniref:outer membrane beta-barrel protein n=1 Tax=Apibacter muscae TaxID=2509004 RepID=UPI0011AD68E6|nr:outer membrane beta-barrel protein [Apibacter muscae]TWP29602.1 hypothetical protein ETU08_07080 [Apibacter muscae]
MKKIILVAFTIVSVLSVHAQKGSIMLGTDLGYSRVDGFDDVSTNTFSFSPAIAYEVANNFYLGIKSDLSYSESSEKFYDINGDLAFKDKLNNYTTKIGGFIRYYHPFSETFGIYGDLGAGYIQGRQNSTVRDYSTASTYSDDLGRQRQYGYYIDFTPALFINFKNNFGLNVSFGGVEWSDTKTNVAADYKNYTTSKDFDFTFGKAIKVGVMKKFSF